jgi:hypothetical protein
MQRDQQPMSPRPWYATGSTYRFWTADYSVLLYLGMSKGDEPTFRMSRRTDSPKPDIAIASG